MDLSNAVPAEWATLKVLHPVTEEETGIEIDLYGMDSETYRAHERKVLNRRLARAAKRQTMRYKMTAEEIDRDAIETLVAVTKGWRKMVEGGKDIQFSTEAAQDIYSRHRWMRDQVDRFVAERERFFAS